MNTEKLSDAKVLELMLSKGPLNKAREKFASASARIEQAGQQKTPLGPFDLRRMEFEAVHEIVGELGLTVPSEESQTAPSLRFTYKNWRGETRDREVRPLGIKFGSNEWHPEPQWFLLGIDVETGDERNFAIKDIQSFGN